MMKLGQLTALPWEYRLGMVATVLIWLLIALNVAPYEMVPLGGDWIFPATAEQARRLFEITTTSWSNAFIAFLGSYQINLFPAALFSALLIWIGLPYLLLAMAALVYFSFLALARQMAVATPIAAIAGFIVFVFSAPFFDYFVMGWLYMLVSVSLLPLAVVAYLRALAGSRLHIFLAGVLFALSPIQSQATLWFLIVFVALSVSSLIEGDGWRRNATVFAGVMAIFLLGNAYWLPALFLYPPSHVANTDLVTSEVSVGTFANFSLTNALRAWGGLFNFQFETILLKHGGAALSILGPLLAMIGLAWHRARYKWAFGLLMLFPLIILALGMNRDLLALIPFSNVFRDVSRFVVLGLFGTSVLAAMGVAVVMRWCGQRRAALVGTVLVAVLVAGAYPWWSGAMWDWADAAGRDIRFRTKEYPTSWLRLDQRLAQERLDHKALFYPIGGTVSYLDDRRFLGAFQEASDNFANLSPVAGAITINDRKFGVIDGLMRKLADEDPTVEQLQLLSDLGVRLFIFRRNLSSPYPQPMPELVDKMVNTGAWFPWMRDESVDVYAARHFNPNVFARQQPECKSKAPRLEYRRVSPTLYRVRIHGAACPVTLVLNETFHDQWRLARAPSLDGISTPPPATPPVDWADDAFAATKTELDAYMAAGDLTLPHDTAELRFVSKTNQGSIQNDNLPAPSLGKLLQAPKVENAHHTVSNRYANGWEIDPMEIAGDGRGQVIDLFIEFTPQRVYLIGRWITLVAFCALALAMLKVFSLYGK